MGNQLENVIDQNIFIPKIIRNKYHGNVSHFFWLTSTYNKETLTLMRELCIDRGASFVIGFVNRLFHRSKWMSLDPALPWYPSVLAESKFPITSIWLLSDILGYTFIRSRMNHNSPAYRIVLYFKACIYPSSNSWV